jgi:hypothetical protein
VSKLAIQIASRKKGEMKDVEMYRDWALKIAPILRWGLCRFFRAFFSSFLWGKRCSLGWLSLVTEQAN